MGRDLLRKGLYAKSGTGDVQIWPSNRTSRPTVRRPNGFSLPPATWAALFALPIPPAGAMAGPRDGAGSIRITAPPFAPAYT
ncbi:SsgA family sporulation/cell division regulator [Streptomyces piniterrae]|uniref:SsgA family sporulation/cell division regulator n=1 Tax=Streptomyces piniterrae TaxID=2571125 RepID=UPI00319E9933